jgi:thiol-disulfide isomerase/thioredoxin
LAQIFLLALCACRADPTPDEGARPDNSALPEDQRGPTVAAAAAPSAGEGWNAQHIDWQGYEAGLARAKAENKPICLVFYTSWCPHCRNYSHVFDDPKVVERAKRFVMVRANADSEPALASKFAKDGGYIPRTFFLAPDGTLEADIHAPRPKFLYFYDEHDPAPLLAAMDTAQRLVVK